MDTVFSRGNREASTEATTAKISATVKAKCNTKMELFTKETGRMASSMVKGGLNCLTERSRRVFSTQTSLGQIVKSDCKKKRSNEK